MLEERGSAIEQGLTPAARKVLDAASTLFYARGIHAIGVDTIAEAAGVTKKTLYDRFGSKDHLVAAYLGAREQRWQAFLASELADVPVPGAPLAVFDASARWAATYAPRGCSFVNARAELPDPAHPAFAVIDDAKRVMLALFIRLVGPLGAADPTELATALFLLHEGALVSAGLGTPADAWGHARRAAAQLINASDVADT
jgi:AcrR family transcriptional regulator